MDKLKKEFGDEKNAIRKRYDNLKIQTAVKIGELEGQARDLDGEMKVLKDELESLRAAATALNIPPKCFVSHCVDTVGEKRMKNCRLDWERRTDWNNRIKRTITFELGIQDLENAVVRADGCKDYLKKLFERGIFASAISRAILRNCRR